MEEEGVVVVVVEVDDEAIEVDNFGGDGGTDGV